MGKNAVFPTPRGTDAKVAGMFNVSERSVRSANRVLADGDEQLIAAVTEGVVSVSDAAAIVKLPKPKQRELLELVRSGKARTLRAAAKVKKPKTLPPAVLRSDSSEPQVLRGKVRRAYKFFRDEYETICRYVDMAAEGCGYNNPLIQRAREGLAAAQAAMCECDLRYGHARTEKPPTDS